MQAQVAIVSIRESMFTHHKKAMYDLRHAIRTGDVYQAWEKATHIRFIEQAMFIVAGNGGERRPPIILSKRILLGCSVRPRVN
jgi:hypothetical protein